MAHWFGVRPWELDQLTYGEAEEMAERIRKLPPVGGAYAIPAELKK